MDSVTQQFQRFAQDGDVAALGEVFDAVGPHLLSVASRRCVNVADAEDALQATFVVAMRKPGAFDPRRPLAAWLTGILDGEVRNLMRRRRSPKEAQETEPERGPDDPALAAERSDVVRQIRERLESLPEDQREVLRLQMNHGLPLSQIAQRLGISAGAVRMRLHRGIQALKKMIPAGMVALVFGIPSRGIPGVREAVLGAAARSVPVGKMGLLAKTMLVGALGVGLGAAVWMTGVAPVSIPSVAVGSQLQVLGTEEIVPSGDAELDELRRLAVKAPLEELVEHRLVFVVIFPRDYPRDEILWRGLERLCDAVTERETFPDRRLFSRYVSQIIESGDPRLSKALRHRVPGLRRLR